MNTNALVFFLGFLCVLTSCGKIKYISQGNRIYAYKHIDSDIDGPPSSLDSVFFYKVNKGFRAKIEEVGNHLAITPVDSMHKLKLRRLFFSDTIPLLGRSRFNDLLYFPETGIGPLNELSKTVDTLKQFSKLRYLDSKPVFQTLTIPLRIRKALADSIPSDASASYNVGIAFGWKFNYNVYNTKKDIFGSSLNSYSLTPGLFLGTGVVGLDKTNTQNPPIKFKRSAPVTTFGVFLTLGINRFNFGYAGGADFALGNENKRWNYQGKWWNGLIFTLDLIK